MAERLNIRMHEYDCFNLVRPPCGGDAMVFHEECIGAARQTQDGRLFDTLQNQIARNGDEGKRLIVKMDVEGAEWPAFLGAPESVLNQIDQLVVEFHYADEARFVEAVRKLKRVFHVVHLHLNNYACEPHHEPFPSWAFEVLFVNKTLGVVDTAGTAAPLPHPLDAPNSPSVPLRTITSGTISAVQMAGVEDELTSSYDRCAPRGPTNTVLVVDRDGIQVGRLRVMATSTRSWPCSLKASGGRTTTFRTPAC